jgi:hypothetical protein
MKAITPRHVDDLAAAREQLRGERIDDPEILMRRHWRSR